MSVRVIIAISNVEPYSPDLNPIEHLWANMKKWLKKHSCEFEEISKAILNFLV
ncbi:MAG: transposase [Lactobacillales bacterium]|nr:transposase [Lactobacillales bacterium]